MIKKFIKNIDKRGFSLVEMILYVAILSVVMLLVVQSVLGISGTYKNLKALRIAETSGALSMDRITREVRNATSVDLLNSSFGVNPGRLTLNTQTSAGADTTVEFFVSAGKVRVKEGGVDAGALMLNNATTTQLIFSLLSTSTIQAIKTDMIIDATSGAVTKTYPLHSTVILRGSY